MDVDIIVKFKVIIYSTMAGGAGGIALFVLMLKKGRYKNNRYKAKCLVEAFGAMVTVCFITFSLVQTVFGSMLINKNDVYLFTVPAFAIGVAWSNIIQIVRIKTTKLFEALFSSFG